MKRLLIVLFLALASVAYGQQFITVTPVVGSTGLSCDVTVGNDTVTSSSLFGSVAVGQAVYGVGIPYGTTVAVCIDTLDSIVLSEAATQGGTKILSFGYLDPNLTAYGTGDWFGLPFKIYSGGGGDAWTLQSVEILDNADILGNCDLVLFNAFSDTLGQDSVAAVIVADEASKVLGVLSLTTAADLGGVRALSSNNIGMIVPRSALYGRLWAKSTMTPTDISNIKIRFGFK